ncbi:MAG: DNA repair protein RecN [Pseudomonadales bacterium]|nr:DNA repair protein RecN [Pseudomonadales bacterium]
MLSHLVVQNFALVDYLELDFQSGMTVVTGETGAGKSIILDALGFALGDRADTGYIANNADRAEIHATFDITDSKEARQWLDARDLLNPDETDCILRRVISNDGRSRGFINGAPSTVGDMKELGEILIDIHSQHEHQSLLKKATHQRLLDEFGSLVKQTLQISELAAELKSARRGLDDLLASNAEKNARLQLLTYQAEELEQLALKPDEHLSLEEERRKLANAESILRNCNAVVEMCEGSEGQSLLDQLGHAEQLLAQAQLDELGPVQEMFASARIQLEEATSDLERFASGFELNPERLQDVEDRLSAIYELARKHRTEIEQLPELAESIQAELASLNNMEVEIDRLDKTVADLKSQYLSAAAKLSNHRRKAARKLQGAVNSELARLGMSGASFEVSLSELPADSFHPNGLEDIEFLISTNPGQAPKSLNKIASGGELSRISLAIQVVTANTSEVPTLVFDEVDVGIGGGTAEVVGAMIRQLGENAQIICVTHLPQVASQGHQHYLVAKHGDKKKIQSSINVLDQKARIKELARMLGGIEITNESLAHAEAMFQAANQAIA